MPTILVQPAMRAAMSADSPTVPVPKIAMLEPASGPEGSEHRTGAGLDATAERRHDLERDVRVKLDHAPLRRHTTHS